MLIIHPLSCNVIGILLRHVTDQDFAHVITVAVEAFNTWHF